MNSFSKTDLQNIEQKIHTLEQLHTKQTVHLKLLEAESKTMGLRISDISAANGKSEFLLSKLETSVEKNDARLNDFLALSDKNWIITVLLSIFSTVIALSSLAVSYFDYKRDQGRLDVTIGLNDIYAGIPLIRQGTGIQIKVINSGRRSVTTTGLNFEKKGNWWKTPIRFILPKNCQPGGMMIYGGLLNVLFLDAQGRFKTLKEGESESAMIPFNTPQEKEEWRNIIKKAEGLYVADSIGNKHKVSWKMIWKLKRDILT